MSLVLYTEDHPHTEDENRKAEGMSNLDETLAEFLKQKRGSKTYAAFARELGIAESTLYRLVHREQSATLEKVEQILVGLKASPKDVFGAEIFRVRSRRG